MKSPKPPSRRRKKRQSPPVIEAGDLAESGAVQLTSPGARLVQFFSPVLVTLGSPWFWPFFISGATAIGAMVWMYSLPPISECRNLDLGASDAERLYCADLAARQGNVRALMTALDLVAQWPEDHPLYSQAQELSNEWSQATIVIARRQMEQGNQDYAKTIIQKVPKSSQYYAQAQDLLNTWTTDEGSILLAQAETAIKAADWPAALDITRRLSILGSEHWSTKSTELLGRINYERQAWGTLETARDLASWNTAQELVAAIVLAQAIDRNTVAGQLVPKEIGAWVDEVLTYAQEWEQAGDITAAVDLITQIAPSLPASAQNSPILILGRAQAAASQGTLSGYLLALLLLEQLPADERLNPYISERQLAWEAEAKNLGQLNMAQWLAGFDVGLGYQLAIQQAQTVALGQPRRPEAQGLIAQWQRQAQASQEQPLLRIANQIAETDTLDQAIVVANRIPANSMLSGMAQAQIRQWQGELQREADQVTLADALALAKDKKLSEAIALARKIGENSPVYQEARQNIRTWENTLRQEELRNQPAPSWWSTPTESTPEPEASPETPESEPTPEASPESPAPEVSPSPTTPSPETTATPTSSPSPESSVAPSPIETPPPPPEDPPPPPSPAADPPFPPPPIPE